MKRLVDCETQLDDLKSSFQEGFLKNFNDLRCKTISGENKQKRLIFAYDTFSRSLLGNNWIFYLRLLLNQIFRDIWYIDGRIYLPRFSKALKAMNQGLKRPADISDKTIYKIINEIVSSNSAETLEQNINKLCYNLGRKIASGNLVKAFIIRKAEKEIEKSMYWDFYSEGIPEEYRVNEKGEIVPLGHIPPSKLYDPLAKILSEDEKLSLTDQINTDVISKLAIDILFDPKSAKNTFSSEEVKSYIPYTSPLFAEGGDYLSTIINDIKSAISEIISEKGLDDKPLNRAINEISKNIKGIYAISDSLPADTKVIFSLIRKEDANKAIPEKLIRKNTSYKVEMADRVRDTIRRVYIAGNRPTIREFMAALKKERKTEEKSILLDMSRVQFESYILEEHRERGGREKERLPVLNRIVSIPDDLLSFVQELSDTGLKLENLKKPLESVNKLLSFINKDEDTLEKAYNKHYINKYSVKERIDKVYDLKKKLGGLMGEYIKSLEAGADEKVEEIKKEIGEKIIEMATEIKYLIPLSLIKEAVGKRNYIGKTLLINAVIHKPLIPTREAIILIETLSDIVKQPEDDSKYNFISKKLNEKIVKAMDDIIGEANSISENPRIDETKRKRAYSIATLGSIYKAIIEKKKEGKELATLLYVAKSDEGLYFKVGDNELTNLISVPLSLYSNFISLANERLEKEEEDKYKSTNILLQAVIDLYNEGKNKYQNNKNYILQKLLETNDLSSVGEVYSLVRLLPPLVSTPTIRVPVEKLKVGNKEKSIEKMYLELTVPIAVTSEAIIEIKKEADKIVEKTKKGANELQEEDIMKTKVSVMKFLLGRHIVLNQILPFLGLSPSVIKEVEVKGKKDGHYVPLINVNNNVIEFEPDNQNVDKIREVVRDWIEYGAYKFVKMLAEKSDLLSQHLIERESMYKDFIDFVLAMMPRHEIGVAEEVTVTKEDKETTETEAETKEETATKEDKEITETETEEEKRKRKREIDEKERHFWLRYGKYAEKAEKDFSEEYFKYEGLIKEYEKKIRDLSIELDELEEELIEVEGESVKEERKEKERIEKKINEIKDKIETYQSLYSKEIEKINKIIQSSYEEISEEREKESLSSMIDDVRMAFSVKYGSFATLLLKMYDYLLAHKILFKKLGYREKGSKLYLPIVKQEKFDYLDPITYSYVDQEEKVVEGEGKTERQEGVDQEEVVVESEGKAKEQEGVEAEEGKGEAEEQKGVEVENKDAEVVEGGINGTITINGIIGLIMKNSVPLIAESVGLYSYAAGLIGESSVESIFDRILGIKFSDLPRIDEKIISTIEKGNKFYKKDKLRNKIYPYNYHTSSHRTDYDISKTYNLVLGILSHGGKIDMSNFLEAMGELATEYTPEIVSKRITESLTKFYEEEYPDVDLFVKSLEVAAILATLLKKDDILVITPRLYGKKVNENIGTKVSNKNMSKMLSWREITSTDKEIENIVENAFVNSFLNLATANLEEKTLKNDRQKLFYEIIKLIVKPNPEELNVEKLPPFAKGAYKKYIDELWKKWEDNIDPKVSKTHPGIVYATLCHARHELISNIPGGEETKIINPVAEAIKPTRINIKFDRELLKNYLDRIVSLIAYNPGLIHIVNDINNREIISEKETIRFDEGYPTSASISYDHEKKSFEIDFSINLNKILDNMPSLIDHILSGIGLAQDVINDVLTKISSLKNKLSKKRKFTLHINKRYITTKFAKKFKKATRATT